jgi:hypothetical protein
MIRLPKFAARTHFVNEQLVFSAGYRRTIQVAVIADPHHIPETPFQQIFGGMTPAGGIGIFRGAFGDAEKAITQISSQLQRLLLTIGSQ